MGLNCAWYTAKWSDCVIDQHWHSNISRRRYFSATRLFLRRQLGKEYAISATIMILRDQYHINVHVKMSPIRHWNGCRKSTSEQDNISKFVLNRSSPSKEERVRNQDIHGIHLWGGSQGPIAWRRYKVLHTHTLYMCTSLRFPMPFKYLLFP